MARKCTICIHPDREAINQALVTGGSNRSIAKQYDVNHNAVQRHRAHIPDHLTKAKEAQEVTQADDLLIELMHLKRKALSLLDQAERAQDLRAAASLLGQARQTIEVLAEIRGELDRKAEVNIVLNPQYQQVQNIILAELSDYPEIRHRIADRLGEIC